MADLDSLPATLIAETTCYACYGLSMYEIFKIGLLRRQALALNASADVTPAGLITAAKCYACYGATIGEMFELSLLTIIAAASS